MISDILLQSKRLWVVSMCVSQDKNKGVLTFSYKYMINTLKDDMTYLSRLEDYTMRMIPHYTFM